jgi:hypothetical protein
VVDVQRRDAPAGVDLVEGGAELLTAGAGADALAAEARQLRLPVRVEDVRHPSMIADGAVR